MPIDTSVYSLYHPNPAGFIDPLAIATKRANLALQQQQIATSQEAQKTHQLANAETQRAQQAERLRADLTAKNTTQGENGEPVTDDFAVIQGLSAAGHAKEAAAVDAQRRVNLTSKIADTKARLDNIKQTTAQVAQRLGPLVNLAPDQAAAQYPAVRAGAIKDGIAKPEDIPEQYDPGFVNQHYQAAIDADKQNDNHQKTLEFAQKVNEQAPKTFKEWSDLALGQASAARNQDELDSTRQVLISQHAPKELIAQLPTTWSQPAMDALAQKTLSAKDRATEAETKRHNLAGEPAGQMDAIMNSPLLGGGAPPAQSPSTPTSPGGPQGPQIPQGTLAAKNNNPANLRFAGQPGATEGEGGFAKFSSPAAGEYALLRQIKLDQGRPLTLQGYIEKFAPATDNNDTAAYIANAEKALGVPRNTPLANVDAGKLAQFQMKQESGATPGQPGAPATATLAGNAPAPVGGPTAAAPPSANGRDESVLANVNPAIANDIRAYADGRKIPPPANGRGPIGMLNQFKNQLLMRYDPQFDTTNAGQRVKTANDFAPSGASGKAINSIGLALQHGAELSDLIEGLNNTSFPKYNNITNWLSKESGSPEVGRFENVRNKFAIEMERAWRGTGLAEADIQRGLNDLRSADSPAKLRNVLADDVNLLTAKYGESKHQYEGSMGQPFPEAKGISKEAQAAAQKITGRRGGPAASIKLNAAGVKAFGLKPGQDSFTPHGPAEAEAFKRDHPDLIQ